ncbi:MAG: STAS domain-containing protein [Actinobacteria bacterium]|nr:STAS domain-containing protein [Actinomycetota bacterium]
MLDLTAVSFIDSSGIRALCRAADEAARRGVAFQAVEASGPVARTL